MKETTATAFADTTNLDLQFATIQNKVENATNGLIPSFAKRLILCEPRHVLIICDYIIALRSELKLSDNYRQNILTTLTVLSRISDKKDFKDFTRSDVIAFLDRYRKNESVDPSHRWIGTYNSHLVDVTKFFKWLYYPDIEPRKRPKPNVVQNLSKLKRREISGYKPSDMWDAEDNLIFLRYCPSPRDKCYHGMIIDTSARPHELLKLRIKDIEFVDEEGGRYAKIVVNGKTGEHPLALIDSLPYITQWISLHPQGSNREAILLPSLKTGRAVQVNAMFIAYRRYKKYFASLLSSEDVPQEDKKKIRELLKKPWNPYVHRHSALTEKCSILNSDSKLRQYAGWSVGSNMHRRYVHFSGGESMGDLLKLKGIVKDDKRSINILKPKQCPNCSESNRPDAQFCYKCNFVMSFDAFQKGREKKDQEIQEIHGLKEQVNEMRNVMKKLDSSMRIYRSEFMYYVMKFGHPFTGKDRKRLEALMKKIEADA